MDIVVKWQMVAQVSMVLGWDAECDVDASVALFNCEAEHVDQVRFRLRLRWKIDCECVLVRNTALLIREHRGPNFIAGGRA